MSFQQTIIVGRLGADPELRSTQNGTSVANMRVATSRTYEDRNGQKQEETFWHDVVVWGDQAENCAKYLSKGRRVCAEGRLEQDEYTDRNNVERTSVQLRARSVTFLGGGDGAGGREGAPKSEPSPGNPAGGGEGAWPDEDGGPSDEFDDDDIPF